MKLTLYSLATDTRDGTTSEVFATKALLDQRLKEIIEEHIAESGDDSNTVRQLREYLAAGEIDEAWEFYEEHYRDAFDTYSIETHDIELPEVAELHDAASRMLGFITHRLPAAMWMNEPWLQPAQDAIANAEKRFNP